MTIFNKTALQLRDDVISGELSAVEITDYFLARIEKYDAKLGAFLTVLQDSARRQAALVDRKRRQNRPLGPLAGVPIAIKDAIHIKGEITTCGSKMLENYVAPFDATAVEWLKKADAILIGKTNLDEFSMGSSNETSAFGNVNNPWDLQAVPGGSSGGSAAAVAARLTPLALGGETGGSIRIPSSFCGVFGIKPSYGRVSRSGIIAYSSFLDQIGTLAHSAEDCFQLLKVISQPCTKDGTYYNEPLELDKSCDPAQMTVGVPYEWLKPLDPEYRELFDKSLKALKELGVKLVPIKMPSMDTMLATYCVLAYSDAAGNLARFDGIRYGRRSKRGTDLESIYVNSRSEGFGLEVKKRIIFGTYFTMQSQKEYYYLKARKIARDLYEHCSDLFKKVDIIATPVSPTVAFKQGDVISSLEMYLQDVYTLPANLAHICAISVPSFADKNNKPFGLQFLADKMKENTLFKLSYAYEKFVNINSIPPLFARE